MNMLCPHCGGHTIIGDIRSGILSFGAFFLEFDSRETQKPRAGVKRDNRVISHACTDCGLVSSYLASVIKK